jgi:hypothetical protein
MLPQYDLNKPSNRRAYRLLLEACISGYKQQLYKVIQNRVYNKNDICKDILINGLFDAFRKSLCEKNDDPLNTFLDVCKKKLIFLL